MAPKHKIGKRIKDKRIEKGLSQEQLAEKCGWLNGAARISHYETGKRGLGIDDIEALSKALETPVSYFYGDESFSTNNNILNIPLVEWDSLYSNTDLNSIPSIQLSLNFEHLIAFRVKGDSMESLSGISFPDNTIIFVDIYLKPKSGDFVIAKLEDDGYVFRQIILEGSNRYLKALNKSWQSINLTDRTQIIGTAKASYFQL